MLHYTEAVVRPPWIHEETYALAADRRPFFNSSVRNYRPFDQRIRVPDIATVCHRRPAPASKSGPARRSPHPAPGSVSGGCSAWLSSGSGGEWPDVSFEH